MTEQSNQGTDALRDLAGIPSGPDDAQPAAIPAEPIVEPTEPSAQPVEPVGEPAAAQEPLAPAAAETAETPAQEPPPPAANDVSELPADTQPIVPEAPAAAPVPRATKKAKAAKVEPVPEPTEPKSENMDWYILKIQSNREESIREGLLRRVAIAGLGRFFGDVIVPTEKVTEFKGGKKRVIKRKLYPGYLVVHMEINEDTWFLVRETPGIGDFTGASGHPTPMLPHEISRILAKQEEKSEKAPKLKIGFAAGERVKINEGTFENFEGEVDSIDETNGRVTVMINIFGRSTPVELEYWQIEAV